MDLGNYQNNIPELQPLNNYRYENIFKMYKDNDNKLFYNITKKVVIPPALDPSQFFYFTVNRQMPWTMISFNLYETIELWWLICLFNNISNPIKQPKAGTILKALKPDLVTSLINDIKVQLN